MNEELKAAMARKIKAVRSIMDFVSLCELYGKWCRADERAQLMSGIENFHEAQRLYAQLVKP